MPYIPRLLEGDNHTFFTEVFFWLKINHNTYKMHSYSRHSTDVMIFSIAIITVVAVNGCGIEQNFWTVNISKSGIG